MIIYTMLLYYFWSGLCVDGLNLYPNVFRRHPTAGTATCCWASPPPPVSWAWVGGIIFGRLCIKTGVRKLCSWALIVTGVLYAIFGYVMTPVMYFIVLTAFTFVSMAFGLIGTATLMGNWFPRKKGIALGWATMGAPPVLRHLPRHPGCPLRHCPAAALPPAPSSWASWWWCWASSPSSGSRSILRKWAPTPTTSRTTAKQLAAQLNEMKSYKSPFTIGRLLRDKDMWLISVGFGMLWMVTVGIVSQFIPRMQSVGYDQGTATMMLTIAAIIGLVGSYFWGWLDQKIGTKAASCVYALCYIVALLPADLCPDRGPDLHRHPLRGLWHRRPAEPDGLPGHRRVRPL